MKKALSVLLALLILLSCTVLFSACSSSSKEYPVTIGDVTVKSEPKNIVVLNDDLADIISYIGYDVKMVGKAITCDQDFLKVVPSVGTSDNPSIDTIQSYETDLVIADKTLNENSRRKLEEAGITVISFDKETSFDELKALYEDLGAVLGGNVTGRQKGIDAYDDMVSTLSSFKKAVSGVVMTFAYLYLNEEDELCTFSKNSIEAKILSYTGALNIFANQDTPKVDSAELKMGTPTYIFYDSEDLLSYLEDDESLSTLTAVTSERTYMIPLKDFSRHGTTMLDTVFNLSNIMFVQSETEEATPDEVAPSETLGELTPPADTEDTEDSEDDEDTDEDAYTYDENGNIVY